jgi:class 3 adenylate cyclase
MTAVPVTLLFTDLVDSTGLLQRVGEERAQHVMWVHRQLLREALAGHGVAEVKWLGDGLLDLRVGGRGRALRGDDAAGGTGCTVGERLGLRIGLHVGEMQAGEGDYAGSPVVLARRPCERAGAGQILCGGVVVELLRGRQRFPFVDVGLLALKGSPEPVAG